MECMTDIMETRQPTPTSDSKEIPATTSTNDEFKLKYRRDSGMAKSPSTIEILDALNGTPITTLKSANALGKGSYASVRRFSNNDISLAVKKPRRHSRACQSQDFVIGSSIEVNAEFYFLQKAYPDEYPYELFEYSEDNPAPDESFPFIHDYRMIIPFVPGCTLQNFMDTLHDFDSLAIVILNIALELQRIHDLGIVHGDISPRNIMVLPDLSIHFIDFDFAYFKTELATVAEVKNIETCYFAPERLNTKMCPAHTSQDIYSLAYAMNLSVKRMRETVKQLEFIEKFPTIMTFISDGLSHAPEDRQPLSRLIESLSNTLFTPRLKHALQTNITKLYPTLIDDYIEKHTETELHQLLHSLCINKQYESAQRLIDHVHINSPDEYLNPMYELFSLMIELGKRLPTLYSSQYHAATRAQVSKSLLTCFNLADVVIKHTDTLCSAALHHEILKTPALKEIYKDLQEKNYLQPWPMVDDSDLSLEESSDERIERPCCIL